jgi:hypothetical protein
MRSHAGALACASPLQRRTVPSLHPYAPMERSPTAVPPMPEPPHRTLGPLPLPPGCRRYWYHSCKRTFNDLTDTLVHQSQRPLASWILATFLLCLACSSRRIAREVGVHVRTSYRWCWCSALRPCPMRGSANWRAPWKRMTSRTPLARRAKRNTAGKSPWDARHVGAARSVNRVGGMTTKSGPR